MECRTACAACCIAPSITTPLPGMPQGKPAGVPCVNLDSDLRCTLFGSTLRPSFCNTLQPNQEMCGNSKTEALAIITQLEIITSP